MGVYVITFGYFKIAFTFTQVDLILMMIMPGMIFWNMILRLRNGHRSAQ